MSKHSAEKIAGCINDEMQGSARYWRAVENDYVLEPGFEP
jgi:hypothetical protein